MKRSKDTLPRAAGDMAFATAYAAAHDTANAVASYERVWLEYPVSTQAQAAEIELQTLTPLLGASYHSPAAPALLLRATKLMEARNFEQARRELTALAESSTGLEHDLALVRIGVAEQRARHDAVALEYLRAVDVKSPEARAEALYYTVAAARRLNRTEVMDRAVEQLERNHANSDWRLQALVAAGDEYFVLNRPHNFESLYAECYEQFPKLRQAAYCHWRVAFSAYLENRNTAADLLWTHVRSYPDSDKASAALYFLGRLAERASKWDEARAFYAQIQRSFPNYYYAVLARTRMREPELMKAELSPAAATLLNKVNFAPAYLTPAFDPRPSTLIRFERARLLRAAKLDEYADLELRFGADKGEQPAAFGLELARAAQLRAEPHRAIRYLKHYAPGYLLSPVENAPREFWTLAFPLPWREPLEQYATKAGVDPFLVAALVRQESEFDPRAISRARAYGLTQVLPSTGRELSRRLNIRGFTSAMLFEPAVNLQLGTHYLRALLNRFNGNEEEALAAYNAGNSRAAAWLLRSNFHEPAEFVESIPFSETRNYVQVVIRNADLYRRLYAHPAQ